MSPPKINPSSSSVAAPHRDTSPCRACQCCSVAQVLAAVLAVAGVQSAATVTGLPLMGTSDGMNFSLVGGPGYGDPSKRPGIDFQSV